MEMLAERVALRGRAEDLVELNGCAAPDFLIDCDPVGRFARCILPSYEVGLRIG